MTANLRGVMLDMNYTTPTVREICTSTEAKWKQKTYPGKCWPFQRRFFRTPRTDEKKASLRDVRCDCHSHSS